MSVLTHSITTTAHSTSVFYGGSYRFYRRVPASSTLLPTVLYVIGFVCLVVGGVIVVLEVRSDLRAARQIPEQVTYESVEAAPDVLRRRLEAWRWRIAGVVLIFVGAGVGLAANLLALSRT
jgi:hypothetical protein